MLPNVFFSIFQRALFSAVLLRFENKQGKGEQLPTSSPLLAPLAKIRLMGYINFKTFLCELLVTDYWITKQSTCYHGKNYDLQ